VTVPTIIYFVYSVLQDPITPSVMKDAWDVAKLKYFGYISGFKKGAGAGDAGAGARDKHIFDRAMSKSSGRGDGVDGTGSGAGSAGGGLRVSDDEVDVEDLGRADNILHKD
jgi:hypothetical protein